LDTIENSDSYMECCIIYECLEIQLCIYAPGLDGIVKRFIEISKEFVEWKKFIIKKIIINLIYIKYIYLNSF